MVELASECVAGLQARASTGRLKFWEIHEKENGDESGYFTVSYNETASGGQSKAVISAITVCTPKNVGKSNETSSYDQMKSEIQSQISKKKDKGYWVIGEPEPVFRQLPMLAQSYDKHAKKINYPAYVQPKADGVRCLTDGKTFWSRGGKDFPEACVAHLKMELPEGMILDGELMLNKDDYTFQQGISATKKYSPLSAELKLHVYDCIITNHPHATFNVRIQKLAEWFANRIPQYADAMERIDPTSSTPEIDALNVLFEDELRDFNLTENILFHPTYTANGVNPMKELHGHFTAEGWEGTIIRNKTGEYKVSGRSYDLQKYKEFLDDEFEIVNVEDGVGKFDGHAIIVCKNANGQTFKVTPKADMATRKMLYDGRNGLIGKMYTVRYQELTDDGIPRFPIGIEIRDYE